MGEIDKLEKMILEKKPLKCSQCGGRLVFEGSGAYRCVSCKNIELDNFGKVKKFLDENGAASAIVIEQATGVNRKVIEQMLREGRLEIPEPSAYYIKCERCGCDIRYGRFCPECIKELAGGIKAIFNSEIGEKPKLQGKMRFFTDKR